MGRIGVAFTGGLTPPEIVECVTLAEDLGYDSAWMTEGHGGDQFAVLAACAAATRRIRLGTAISSVFVRSAPTIALAAATVDHLAGGRFVLGLGSSHRVQVEGEHGLPYGQPIERVRETVEVVRAILRDGAASYRGRLLTIERFDLWFRPLRPEIPIHLAAVFGPMLEVCGEIAQGAILNWTSLEMVRRAREHVAVGARRAGRSPEAVEMVSLLSCSLAPSHQAAVDAMRPAVARYGGFFPRYNRLLAESGFPEAARAIREAWARGERESVTRLVPDALIETVAIVGTAAECRERIAAYQQGGLDLPVISPRVTGPDTRQAIMNAMRACAP